MTIRVLPNVEIIEQEEGDAYRKHYGVTGFSEEFFNGLRESETLPRATRRRPSEDQQP